MSVNHQFIRGGILLTGALGLRRPPTQAIGDDFGRAVSPSTLHVFATYISLCDAQFLLAYKLLLLAIGRGMATISPMPTYAGNYFIYMRRRKFNI